MKKSDKYFGSGDIIIEAPAGSVFPPVFNIKIKDHNRQAMNEFAAASAINRLNAASKEGREAMMCFKIYTTKNRILVFRT